jgi:hypothetical protein
MPAVERDVQSQPDEENRRGSCAREKASVNSVGKDGTMRALLLLIALSTLAACSQTGRTASYNSYTPGQGDYYPGIIPPTQF